MAGFTLIASMSAPSSNVFAFTGLSLGSYSVLRIVCSGITVTTDGTDIGLTMYVAGVEQTGASDYGWGFNGASSLPNSLADGLVSAANILLVSNDAQWDVGNAAGEAFGSIVTLDQPASTALHKRVVYHSWYDAPPSDSVSTRGVGLLKNTAAINGIKISGTSNLTAGNVRILGL